MSEKEIERMIREEYGLGEASEDEENNNDDNVEDDGENDEDLFDVSKSKKSGENKPDSSIYGDYEDAVEENENGGEGDDDGDDASKPLKRLKKIAGEILLKRKEKEDARKMKEERRARRKALLANPLMKRLMGDMIEDEAE